MCTQYRIALRTDMKSFPVQYELQVKKKNWNNSFTHIEHREFGALNSNTHF